MAKSWTDLELIQGCQSRQAAAQRALYERFAAALYGVCRRYGRDTMEAEDMHQLGFIRIFDQIGRFAGTTRPELEAWMRRVMVTTSLNALANQQRHKVWLNPSARKPPRNSCPR